MYFAIKIWCCRLDWAIMLTQTENVWFPSFSCCVRRLYWKALVFLSCITNPSKVESSKALNCDKIRALRYGSKKQRWQSSKNCCREQSSSGPRRWCTRWDLIDHFNIWFLWFCQIFKDLQQALISKTKRERKTKALHILLLSVLGVAEEIPDYCWVLPSH